MTTQPIDSLARLACFPASLGVHSDWLPAARGVGGLDQATSGRVMRCNSQWLLSGTPRLSRPLHPGWQWLLWPVQRTDALALHLVTVCAHSLIRNSVERKDVKALKQWLGHALYDAAFLLDDAWAGLSALLPSVPVGELTASPALNLGRGALLQRAQNESAAHALRLRWRYPADPSLWATGVQLHPRLHALLDAWLTEQLAKAPA